MANHRGGIDGGADVPLGRRRRAGQRRRLGRIRGVHAPDSVRGRSRGHPPGTARARADPDDARPALRPDDRDGRGAPARLLLRRQPGRGRPSPLPRRGREWLAAPDRDRGAQPRRDGQPLRRRRGRDALRDHARLPRDGPDGAHHGGRARLSVHGRATRRRARAPSRRRDRPRPGGRPRGQRPALGYPRRAEGGGPRRAALAGHGGADRRRARAAAGRNRHPRLGDQRGGGGARGLPAVLQPRHHRSRQRLLPVLGQAQSRPGSVHRMDEREHPRSPGGRAMTATQQVTAGETQTVVAARRLRNTRTVFIGVGRPSTAAILARMVHNPELVLVYESGTIGAKPYHIPLSIGDGELAETADAVVSSCEEVVVIVPHTKRTFVPTLDFRTTVGYGDGPGDRERLGFRGRGPTAVITDLGVLEPDPDSDELTLVQIHDGVTVAQVKDATGWELAVVDPPLTTPAATDEELAALRELLSR